MNEQHTPAFKVQPHIQKARIGVVSLVYHQQTGSEPVSVESRFSRWLESDEQPYLRKLTIKEEWTALDGGWLKEVGEVFLRNDEGKFQVQPTDEERAAVMARVVEIAVVEPVVKQRLFVFGRIRPLESLQFEPHDLTSLRLRCVSGTARCTLALFPR